MSDEVRNSARLPTAGDETGWTKYQKARDQLLAEKLVSVRQIPPNRRSVTGRSPSRKNGRSVAFESALERDFAAILEFDTSVERYETQPMWLEYSDSDGRKRRGVPDFLVTFRRSLGLTPILCDVKYRRELFERWTELKPRLKAARAYAQAHNLTYRIKTEVEIRRPYLYNAKFLLPYQRLEPDPAYEEELISRMLWMESATPQSLLEACATDPWRRAELIPTLWNLVARRRISVDLEQPLTMRSDLWHPRVDP